MVLFPTDMLHFILRANEVTTGFLSDYFQHSVTYLDYLSKHGSATSTLARPMHWVKAWLDGLAPQRQGQENSNGEESLVESAETSVEEASHLAHRVEELEKRLKQLELQGEE